MAHQTSRPGLRMRRSWTGSRVTCRKSIRVPQRSTMADALARLDDASNVHWTHSTPEFAHYTVTSLGVQWLREELEIAEARIAFAREVRAAFQVAA